MSKQNKIQSFSCFSKSTIENIQPFNSHFDKGIIKIAYHGLNRNKSYISKKVFENAIPSLYNVPIIAHYIKNAEDVNGNVGDFGEHDVKLVLETDDSGNVSDIKIQRLTVPLGVVPESMQWFWQEVEEDNGETHEYLCCDVLLWKITEEYRKALELKTINHSMEVSITEWEEVEDVLNIKSMEFVALCLLGTKEEPCYESSKLELFTLDNFNKQWKKLLMDLKNEKNNQSETIAFSKKKGVCDLKYEKKLQEVGLSKEDFELKFKLKLSEIDEETFNAKISELQTFSLTVQQQMEAIIEKLREVKTINRWNELVEVYGFIDFYTDTKIVIAYKYAEQKLVGLPYQFNNDTCIIDFEKEVLKKVAYVDFEEGDTNNLLNLFVKQTKGLEDNIDTLKKDIEKLEANCNTFKKENEEVKKENEELKEFKLSVEAEKIFKAKQDVLANFNAELSENKEFVEIKAKVDNKEDAFTTEVDLQNACFVLLGKQTKDLLAKKQANFSLEKINGVAFEQAETNPQSIVYGGFIEQYKDK